MAPNKFFIVSACMPIIFVSVSVEYENLSLTSFFVCSLLKNSEIEDKFDAWKFSQKG